MKYTPITRTNFDKLLTLVHTLCRSTQNSKCDEQEMNAPNIWYFSYCYYEGAFNVIDHDLLLLFVATQGIGIDCRKHLALVMFVM